MRTRLKLKFTGLAALQDLWERELKRSQVFIPARRCLPVETPVTLVIGVPEAPGPLELNGVVRVAREQEHCAANQKPGMGIEIELARRERRAVEAYVQGDWAGAAQVIGVDDSPPSAAPAPQPSAPPQAFAPPQASASPPAIGAQRPLSAAPRVPPSSGRMTATTPERRTTGSMPAIPGPAAASAPPRPATGSHQAQSRASSSGVQIQSSSGRHPTADGSIVAVRRQRTTSQQGATGTPQEQAVAFAQRHAQSNHFEVLGLARGASEDEIRRSYVKLVKQFHPDRYFGRLDEESMHAMEMAYQLVTDAYEALTSGQAAASPGAARRPTGPPMRKP